MHTSEGARESRWLPSVFTKTEQLNKGYRLNEPTNRDQYAARGLSVPECRTYAINNDIVAAVDDAGNISVVMNKSGDQNRLDSIQAAIEEIEQMGYKQASFYVPTYEKPPSQQ